MTDFPFDHHSLDLFKVSKEALVQGDRIVRQIPRGYGVLADQLRRALQGQYLQMVEAASRTAADRATRLRTARAEAAEAAACIEVLIALHIAPEKEATAVIELLWRASAMLHGLANR